MSDRSVATSAALRSGFLFCVLVATPFVLACFVLELIRGPSVDAATGIGMAKTAVVQSENGPRGYQQLSVTASAVSTLTVPGGAYIAHIQAYDGNIRYMDFAGTSPTTTTGMCIFAGGDIRYIGDLDAIELISETGTVQVNVLYYGR